MRKTNTIGCLACQFVATVCQSLPAQLNRMTWGTLVKSRDVTVVRLIGIDPALSSPKSFEKEGEGNSSSHISTARLGFFSPTPLDTDRLKNENFMLSSFCGHFPTISTRAQTFYLGIKTWRYHPPSLPPLPPPHLKVEHTRDDDDIKRIIKVS